MAAGRASSHSGADDGTSAYSSDRDKFISWWLVLILGVIAVGLFAFVYGYLGWQRMDAVCSTEAAVPAGLYSGTEVTYSWSWRPFGYTCTWDDISVTRFWW